MEPRRLDPASFIEKEILKLPVQSPQMAGAESFASGFASCKPRCARLQSCGESCNSETIDAALPRIDVRKFLTRLSSGVQLASRELTAR